MDFFDWVRSRRFRRIAILAGLALVLWGILGFFVLPPLLRPVVERKISEALHRRTTLASLAINPFTLSVTLRGLDVKDRDGTSPFLSFESLYANAEAVSIVRRGPVVRTLTLVKPAVSVARNADGTYSVQDLIDAASKPKPADARPLRFSFNNIRVLGGSVDFEDRAKNTKHEVRELEIGIPFLSNIPSKVEITTQPLLRALVNGSPFALSGKTKPFSGTRATTLALELSDVDLPYYLAYLPPGVTAKVDSARLDAKLELAFSQPASGDPSLVVSGTAALRNVSVTLQGIPLVGCERLEVAVDAIDVLGRSARLRSLKVLAPELWISRKTLVEQEVVFALTAPGMRKRPSKTRGPAGPGAPPEHPFSVDLAEAAAEGGVVHYDNLAFDPPFRAILSEVTASLKGLSTRPGSKPASLTVSAKSDAGEAIRSEGTVSANPVVLAGTLSMEPVPLKRYTTFVGRFVPIAIDGGVMALKTGYRWSSGPDGNTVVTDLTASIVSPRVRKKSAKDPFFTAASLATSGTSLDLARHALAIGEVTGTKGMLAILREKDGGVDLLELGKKKASSPAAAAPEPAPEAAPAPAAPWEFSLKKLDLAGWTVRMEDRSLDHAARFALTKTDIILENLSTEEGSKGSLAIGFGVEDRGRASVKGAAGFKPMFADLAVDVKGVDLVPLEAYLLQNIRLSLASGTASAAGNVGIRQDPAGKTSIVWTGDAFVTNLLTVDEATKADFLKWDSFSASGIHAGLNPLFVEVRQLAAVGLACNVAIAPDGTVNLRTIVGAPSRKGEGEGTAPEEAKPAAAPPRPVIPVRIDEIRLENARVGFADHFVKPNYSAMLTDLGARVTGLSSAAGTVATLDLSGRFGNRSPLQVSGTINPLAAATFADVKGTFRDIALPPLTPYSGTYAGYTVANGTLTMEVAYKVENRRLTASNRLYLIQFDFGDHVESPRATKLPVKLAVSVLKDRNGLIDLDVPVDGSLDDPNFKLGNVVLQTLTDLIGATATAPFSVLGKAFGGSGEDLSSVDFPDGLAALDENGKRKLDTLAKALKDRPALRLEATGRTSGEPDLEGLRVERKAKGRKSPDVGEEDLRQLASARANAVRDYLTGPGGVEASRILVLEPGTQPAAPKEKARASRVDFALK